MKQSQLFEKNFHKICLDPASNTCTNQSNRDTTVHVNNKMSTPNNSPKMAHTNNGSACSMGQNNTTNANASTKDKNPEQNPHEKDSRRHQRARGKHPLDAASLISVLFFGWMWKFIWRGWRRGLKLTDAPVEVSAGESCHKIGERLVAGWNKELESCSYASTSSGSRDTYLGRKPSLRRVLFKTHASRIILTSIINIFADVLCKMLSAYSIGQMLSLLSNRELGHYSRAAWSLEDPLMLWTLVLIVTLLVWGPSTHFYGFQMMRLGLRMRIGCSYLIYRKSLKLGQYESSQKTMGRMTNLLSNDLEKFNMTLVLIPYLWVGPLQTIVALYLLWPVLGFASLGSLLFLIIIVPLQVYLSSRFAYFRRRIAACTDERVRLLNETITELKLIKLYGWEHYFRRILSDSRRKETDLINRVGIIKGLSFSFIAVSSKMVVFVALVLHCLVFGGTLDTKTLFMSIAILNNVQNTMTFLIPCLVFLGSEFLVALERMTDFLLTKEFLPSDKLSIEPALKEDAILSGESNQGFRPIAQLIKPDPCANKPIILVECQNVGVRVPGAETKPLEDISFKCESPGLIMICGQLGSGKSSLLLGLLNEMPLTEGRAFVQGSCGFSGQKAWIFNGTVRENILFGSKYDESRYLKIIEICALMRDMELLDRGDLTYIQENSLSGGQKARVNLARCLYRDSDIYFLDDPFSAIDNRVSKHIFDKAIKEFLSAKLVLMTTHEVGLLESSDKVLLLDKGKQLAYCDYNNLRAQFIDADKHFTGEQLTRLAFLIKGLSGTKQQPEASVEETERQYFDPKSSPTETAGQFGAQKKGSLNVSSPQRSESEPADGPRKSPGLALADRRTNENDHPILKQQKQELEKQSNNQCIVDLDEIPKVRNTSESVYAPYGLLNLVSDKDKTLITTEEATARDGADSAHGSNCSLDRNGKRDAVKEGQDGDEEGQSANKVDGKNANTQTIAISQYRTTMNKAQQQQYGSTSMKGKTPGINNSEQKAREIFRPPSNGPADEESSGVVPGWRVWYQYYAQTSVIRFTLVVLTFLITHALFATVDIYLTVWSLSDQNKALVNEITGFNQQLATFEHQNNTDYQYGMCNKTNIEYDSPLLTTFARYNCTDNMIEIAQEIQKIIISPLSSRSSLVAPASISTTLPLLNLFYTTADAGNGDPASNYQSNYSKHQHRITDTTAQFVTSVVPDGNISEESEAALNVRSIYRPLYLFVNNFNSGHHALTYSLLIMVLFSFSMLANVSYFICTNKSAISLYNKLTDNALFAKMAFFDQNPMSRLLNRATHDTGIMDESIPAKALIAYDGILRTITCFILVVSIDIKLVAPSLITMSILLAIHTIFVRPTRDTQRLEGIAKSPIVSHVATTLAGLQTIRATNSEERFQQMFIEHQDVHSSIFLLNIGVNRSLVVTVDNLNAIYTSMVAFWAVVSGLSGQSIGLIITSTMTLCGLTQSGLSKLLEIESLMTGVERIIEYCCLPQEENNINRIKYPLYEGLVNRARNAWPKEGSLEYRHVDLYYDRLQKPVLKNISFKLNAGEKVGIIGRTGAGKSSIITSLFRLYDFEGSILIDGVDIKTINLTKLRTAISIIPQSPVLFSASVRHNLDPLNVYDDLALWTALDKAHLREIVSALPGKLEYNIGNGGAFSSGQKQLICLARVLLKQSRLIVMDEATANVDPTTDAMIQTTIRQEFKHCTVITIAHRLETILDFDRIMVLEAGRIVDFDTPEQLEIKNSSWLFRQSSA